MLFNFALEYAIISLSGERIEMNGEHQLLVRDYNSHLLGEKHHKRNSARR
jgi:hypothetical protein